MTLQAHVSILYQDDIVHWKETTNTNCRLIYTFRDTPTRRLYIMGDPGELNEYNDCIYYEEVK